MATIDRVGDPRFATARVLRGGSWNNNRHNARCAYRNRNNPNNWNNNIGFRVVCVHISACQKIVQFKDWQRGQK